MHLIAQATQPELIVWTQLSPEQIALRITIYSALATSGVIAFFALLKLALAKATDLAPSWFDFRSAWMKKIEKATQANSQAIVPLIDADRASEPNVGTTDVPPSAELAVRENAAQK